MTKEDEISLYLEGRSGQELHVFLGQLAAGVGPIPRLSNLVLLYTKRDGMMHLLHLLLSIPFSIYLTTRGVFTFVGDPPEAGFPQVVDIRVETFAVRSSVRTVTRANHQIQMERYPMLDCQSMPCKQAGKTPPGIQYLDGNIATASVGIYPLLDG